MEISLPQRTRLADPSIDHQSRVALEVLTDLSHRSCRTSVNDVDMIGHDHPVAQRISVAVVEFEGLSNDLRRFRSPQHATAESAIQVALGQLSSALLISSFVS